MCGWRRRAWVSRSGQCPCPGRRGSHPAARWLGAGGTDGPGAAVTTGIASENGLRTLLATRGFGFLKAFQASRRLPGWIFSKRSLPEQDYSATPLRCRAHWAQKRWTRPPGVSRRGAFCGKRQSIADWAKAQTVSQGPVDYSANLAGLAPVTESKAYRSASPCSNCRRHRRRCCRSPGRCQCSS